MTPQLNRLMMIERRTRDLIVPILGHTTRGLPKCLQVSALQDKNRPPGLPLFPGGRPRAAASPRRTGRGRSGTAGETGNRPAEPAGWASRPAMSLLARRAVPGRRPAPPKAGLRYMDGAA